MFMLCILFSSFPFPFCFSSSFLSSPFLHLLSKHCFLVQAEGAGADQAGVGAAAGGGEAGEEGRGAGEDDPG